MDLSKKGNPGRCSLVRWLAFGLLVGFSGCNILDDFKDGHCDIPKDSNGGRQCHEYHGFGSVQNKTFQTVCDGAMGSYGSGACDHSGALGACSMDLPKPTGGTGTEIIWYFPSEKYKTADEVKASCGEGETYIAP